MIQWEVLDVPVRKDSNPPCLYLEVCVELDGTPYAHTLHVSIHLSPSQHIPAAHLSSNKRTSALVDKVGHMRTVRNIICVIHDKCGAIDS